MATRPSPPPAPRTDAPVGRVDLVFTSAGTAEADTDIGEDVSALARVGRTLFCAADEGAAVQQLVWDAGAKRYASHRCVPLAEVFDLPDGGDGEMDIEGLAVDDGWLWIVGSHSLKRPKLPKGADVDAFPGIQSDRNRSFLGRMPLVEREPGVVDPVARDGARRAACLRIRKDGTNAIRRKLGKDALMTPFMAAPAKENGFDIEGLAVRGDRVFLGLRGPVVCTIALLVELRVVQGGRGGLKLAPVTDDGPDYLLHPLPLDGLGVRDLLLDGTRLLVLAGASMGLSGPQAVYALAQLPERGRSVARENVRRVLALPVVDGADHAEGLCEHVDGARRRLMVVCDSPVPERRAHPHTLTADLFAMP